MSATKFSELDTYPMLEERLHNYINYTHNISIDHGIKSATNTWFTFGCRYEFDIIAGFKTEKKELTRLYNIEVKIDSNVTKLLQQARRNIASWFDYCIIAFPMNNNLGYYLHEIIQWSKINDPTFDKIGWLLFDWKTKRTWFIKYPKLNKVILGKKERNAILSKLGFEPDNLLGGY